MSSLRVLIVADHRNSWIENAANEYQEKLSHFCKFSLEALKPLKLGRTDAREKQKKESDLLLEKIKEKDFVILLDENGSSMDSKKFATKIEHMINENPNPKTFVIGGAYGVSEELKKRANLKIRLSDMTLNHHVALLNLLEQIYRSFTIIKNFPYHNE
jgi:23S rRNA (pseudouridine1915-N3)-methyltransferase